VLRRVDTRGAEVEAGPLRMKVALEDLLSVVEEPLKKSAARPASAATLTVQAKPTEEPSANELNVIGCTVEEASGRVDKFIDQAALAGKPRVRVIHGHGTGALRRGLTEFLATHPLVERTSAEAQDRGGNAVMIVELKD
jgi:DNA mismatch repair protein MutS2